MSKDVAIKAKEAKTEKVSVFKKIARFFKDLKSEIKKIVWPTKKNIIHNTGVVIAFMGIVAIALWLLDWIFISLMNLFF